VLASRILCCVSNVVLICCCWQNNNKIYRSAACASNDIPSWKLVNVVDTVIVNVSKPYRVTPASRGLYKPPCVDSKRPHHCAADIDFLHSRVLRSLFRAWRPMTRPNFGNCLHDCGVFSPSISAVYGHSLRMKVHAFTDAVLTVCIDKI